MINLNLPERRLEPRVYAKIPLLCQIFDPRTNIEESKSVMAANISTTGIYFEIGEPLLLKVILTLTFTLPRSTTPITLKAKVVRIEATENEKLFSIGAQFTEVPAGAKELIEQFVNRFDLYKLLQIAVERNASDLHLAVDNPPILRTQGELESLDLPKLTPDDIPGLIFTIMSRPQIKRFEYSKEFDFGLQFDTDHRFRINLHLQRGFLEAVCRLIATREFSFEKLRIPDVVQDLARAKDGLILVAGPTGSGKSTTMAAMVDLINHERRAVIVTLERPIEYVHAPIKSIIKQREIGIDTNSFSAALHASLRQDPNVIVVGELEDVESVKTAFIAAEAGYLVIASFHAPNTAHAIDRLTSIFPAENRHQILIQISNCLRGIIVQMLIPTKDRSQRVLATEALIANDAVKRIIRSDELIQLSTVIQTGKQSKMQSMVDSVKEYVQQGYVDRQTAIFYCREFGIHPHLLEQLNEIV